MVFKIFTIILFFIVVPELIGLIFSKIIENDNIFLAYILGYIVEFAICQVLAVPMIYLECSYMLLRNIILIIFAFLSIVSLVINANRFGKIVVNFIKSIINMPKLLAVIALFLILIQVDVLVMYRHEDEDDATYVAAATVALQTDSLYKYSAQTGKQFSGEHLDSRYRLGPFPIYLAILAGLTNIHPAILAHTIFPAIFIPITYMIYGLMANNIFKEDKELSWLFLIFLAVIHIFGNYSNRNNFTFLLFRPWQGKSVLCNIIIPVVWILFMYLEENEYKFRYCLLIFITILGGVLTTTMGIALPPLVLMSLALAFEIPKLKFKDIINKENLIVIKNILKCFACTIPALFFGALYFI